LTIAILLIAIAILLFTLRPGREYTLSAALLIAAFTWLAIEIHLLRILRDVFAFAVEHWFDTVMAFGAAILLSVPATMLYIAIRDQLDNHNFGRERPSSSGRVRNGVLDKFERRVATLMALGYGRTQAEATALHQMKRDLDRYPIANPVSNDHVSRHPSHRISGHHA
jgi:signal transduction histidine kinase